MKNKKSNILSLFNGMSCGYIASSELGFEINKYYVSEVDKHANKIAELIYPDSIFLGDVRKIDVAQLETIDIVLAGFPCTDLSFAGKKSGLICEGLDEYMELRDEYLQTNDENLYFYNGKFQQSILFYEFLRIWNDVKKINPNALFLVENVKMKQTEELKISKLLGMHPISINAKLVSAQSRDRLFWTNIANKPLGMFGDIYIDIPQPKDKGIYLKDILEDQVDEKYFLSEKIVQGFLKHKERHKEKGNGFAFEPKDVMQKSNTLKTMEGKRNTDTYIKIDKIMQWIGMRKGVSDLHIIGGGKILFIELKIGKGIQSNEQKVFEQKIKSNGMQYWLVYDSEPIEVIVSKILTYLYN